MAWKIDISAKCVLSNGSLTSILLKTGVSDYLNWKPIQTDYIGVQKDCSFGTTLRLVKVPTSAKEAMNYDMMGLFEKRRCMKFLEFVTSFDENKSSLYSKFNTFKEKSSHMFDYFQLEPKTIEYIGSFALQSFIAYKQMLAFHSIKRIQKVVNSFGVYGDSTHIYPDHGQSQITRKLLKKSEDLGAQIQFSRKIKKVVIENNRIVGIDTENARISCSTLICNSKLAFDIGVPGVKKVGSSLVSIMLSKQAQNEEKQSQTSKKIVIPATESGNKHDINILILNADHFVCPFGYKISIVSKVIETENPKNEIRAALSFIGPWLTRFDRIIDRFSCQQNVIGLHIASGYHPCIDLEPEADEALRIYNLMTGQELFLGDPIETQSWETVYTFLMVELVKDCDDDLMITMINYVEPEQSVQY